MTEQNNWTSDAGVNWLLFATVCSLQNFLQLEIHSMRLPGAISEVFAEISTSTISINWTVATKHATCDFTLRVCAHDGFFHQTDHKSKAYSRISAKFYFCNNIGLGLAPFNGSNLRFGYPRRFNMWRHFFPPWCGHWFHDGKITWRSSVWLTAHIPIDGSGTSITV